MNSSFIVYLNSSQTNRFKSLSKRGLGVISYLYPSLKYSIVIEEIHNNCCKKIYFTDRYIILNHFNNNGELWVIEIMNHKIHHGFRASFDQNQIKVLNTYNEAMKGYGKYSLLPFETDFSYLIL